MNGNQVPSFGHDDTTMLLVNFLHLVKPVAGSRRLVDVELSAFYIRAYDSNSANLEGLCYRATCALSGLSKITDFERPH